MEASKILLGIIGIIFFIIGVMGYGVTLVEHIKGNYSPKEIDYSYYWFILFTIVGGILFFISYIF